MFGENDDYEKIHWRKNQQKVEPTPNSKRLVDRIGGFAGKNQKLLQGLRKVETILWAIPLKREGN